MGKNLASTVLVVDDIELLEIELELTEEEMEGIEVAPYGPSKKDKDKRKFDRTRKSKQSKGIHVNHHKVDYAY